MARRPWTIALALGAYGYATTAHGVLSVIELRRGDIAAAAQHLASRAAAGPQFSDLYARPESTVAEAQVTEARDGPAGRPSATSASCAPIRAPGAGCCSATPPSRPGWLGPRWPQATATWLPAPRASRRPWRTTTRSSRPWPRRRPTAGAWPTATLPGLAEAATRHPDPWARASAAEDLGVLYGEQR